MEHTTAVQMALAADKVQVTADNVQVTADCGSDPLAPAGAALARQPQYYCVCVGAQLDERWLEYLPVVRSASHIAPLTGGASLVLHVVDQAELMGIINSLHGLGLSLLLVKRLTNFCPDNP